MQFSAGRPDMVRAINQRWLLNFWKRTLIGQSVPQWQSVEAEDLSRISANLSFLDVIGDGDECRYQIRFNGETIAKVYGRIDCRGKFLDEIIPESRYPEAKAPYLNAVQSACPVYTIHDVTDRDGRVVHYERLILPFANDGETVDRIMASFEFVCLDGAFESHELMKSQAGPPALRVAATISRQTML